MRWLYEILESNICYRTEGRWFIWGRTLDGVCILKEKQSNSFWDRIGQVHHRSYPCPPRPTPTQWDTLKLSTGWGNPLCCNNFSQVYNLPASSLFQVQTLPGLNKATVFDISCCQLQSGPSFTKILENLWMKRNNRNKEQLVMEKQIIQWKRVVCFFIFKEYSQRYQRKYCVQDAIKSEHLKKKNFKYKCWNFLKNLNEQEEENSLYKFHEGTNHFTFSTTNNFSNA